MDHRETARTAAEMLFAGDLMPGCDDALAIGPDGTDASLRYCARFQGHDNYGLDHCSEDGTVVW